MNGLFGMHYVLGDMTYLAWRGLHSVRCVCVCVCVGASQLWARTCWYLSLSVISQSDS